KSDVLSAGIIKNDNFTPVISEDINFLTCETELNFPMSTQFQNEAEMMTVLKDTNDCDDLFDPDSLQSNLVNAAITRAKGLLKSKNVSNRNPILDLHIPDISVAEVIRLQRSDPTLHKIWEYIDKQAKDVNSKYHSYEVRSDLLYRKVIRERLGEKEIVNQLIVPKGLRNLVLSTSHESILGAHFSHKKTLDKIYSCFSWPNCSQDTKFYTRSCDICQRTVGKGAFKKAPMQIAKLADLPFQHISVDLIGEIIPPSRKGHRWVLTIIDNCSRYVDAIPLKKIDTKSVFDALNEFFVRVGYCDTISTDNGSQFTSDLMEQLLKQFNIRHIVSTAYHAQAQGLIERFNQTFKKCLSRLCSERIQDWHLFIGPCLMAMRETVHSGMGVSSNQLVFGHCVKGPLQILKQLMSKENIETEVKTTYQYVLDLRERIHDTCALVQQELRKSQIKNKINFDKSAKHRSFKVGDTVLLLLPLETNKLELKWQGPFRVTKKIAMYDYQIETKSGKLKVFHINMLKLYIPRSDIKDADDVPVVAAIASVLTEELNEHELMVQDSELLVHYTLKQKESYSDVKINPDLSRAQTNDLKKLLFEFQDIFSDVPRITNLGKHKIVLKSDDVIQSKPYPVPVHLRDKLDKELDELLAAGIISPSTGPFSSPIVLILKPDKSLRLCVNYKQLNAISQFDPEPMVLIDDIFDKLGGSRFLSTCDMSKGYYQCELEEESKKYTTFCHPSRGLHFFNVLPFGLSSGPATFTRIMRKLLAGTKNLDFYLDDVITHTISWKDHVDSLRVFFNRVREGNLTLKPSKCSLGFTTLKFLGHKVVEDSKVPTEENLNKIIEAARPETKKHIKSFLGSCGFYHQYIPRFSELVAPLTDCLRKLKPNKVEWGVREEESFQALKRAFLSKPILKLICLE
ncbi:MAG: reverse transcriptase domain-containing protein, partial [Oscillospiraceae bacterium]